MGKESGVFWLFDLLARDALYTRILVFDYDADVTKMLRAISQNNFRGHAEALLCDLAALRGDTYKYGTITHPMLSYESNHQCQEDRSIIFVTRSSMIHEVPFSAQAASCFIVRTGRLPDIVASPSSKSRLPKRMISLCEI